MIKLHNDSNGFSAIEILLVVATLAIVGVAGYFVAKHIDTKKIPQTAATAIAQTTQQYLTIKEWGVRVPMPSNVSVSDIYYVMEVDTQNGSSAQAVLASHKLSTLTSDCTPQAGVHESPFGSIERMTSAAYQQALGDSPNSGVTGGSLLGSYYYVWQVPRANCYSKEAGNSQFTASLNQITDNNIKPVDNFPANINTLLKNIQMVP